jgi:hypothetical protein
LTETRLRVKWARSNRELNGIKLNQLALDVLGLVEDNTRVDAIKLHAKKKRGVPHVFDLELLLHLRPEEEWIAANDNEIIDVGENPKRRGLLAPEDTGVSDRRGEANGGEEGIQAMVPSQQGLFEAVDGFDQSKNYLLVGEIAGRRKHQNFLFKVASQESTLDIELMHKKAPFIGKRKEESEGGGFACRGVLEFKVQAIGLAKTLSTNTSFVLNDLVVSAQLFFVSPCGRNGMMMGLKRDNFPNVVRDHVGYLHLLCLLPMLSVITSHGASMIGRLGRGDREGDHVPGATGNDVVGVD